MAIPAIPELAVETVVGSAIEAHVVPLRRRARRSGVITRDNALHLLAGNKMAVGAKRVTALEIGVDLVPVSVRLGRLFPPQVPRRRRRAANHSDQHAVVRVSRVIVMSFHAIYPPANPRAGSP